MNPHPVRFMITTSLFTVAITASFLGYFLPRTGIGMHILMACIIIYLLFGWYFFRAYYPEGLLVTRFVMGYFYAGIFMGSLFVTADWPLKKIMIMASVLLIGLQAGLVLLNRNKIPRRGSFQFLIQAILLLTVITLHIVSAF